jgi:2-polyprenyl-3-methyl-5-hydroxy-6-metoxy-1,4-benzoquinol methylase|tara:strand:+ start:711 stop:971 length:261 start_codon:yes stop_codon:yes gene_type:complete
VLDIGCGKGEVGQILRGMGFKDIVGIDCSKSLLEQANNTKSYIGTDRVYFGEQNVPIPESYKGKQDFVVCHSMINNILDSSNIIFH